jgi:hypothetical protein
LSATQSTFGRHGMLKISRFTASKLRIDPVQGRYQCEWFFSYKLCLIRLYFSFSSPQVVDCSGRLLRHLPRLLGPCRLLHPGLPPAHAAELPFAASIAQVSSGNRFDRSPDCSDAVSDSERDDAV